MLLEKDKENIIDIMIDPEAHGYEKCTGCNGYGATFDDYEYKIIICNTCGGDGVMPAGTAAVIIQEASVKAAMNSIDEVNNGEI